MEIWTNLYHVQWKPDIALYENRAIRNLELVQITAFVPRCMEINKLKT